MKHAITIENAKYTDAIISFKLMRNFQFVLRDRLRCSNRKLGYQYDKDKKQRPRI